MEFVTVELDVVGWNVGIPQPGFHELSGRHACRDVTCIHGDSTLVTVDITLFGPANADQTEALCDIQLVMYLPEGIL